MATAGDSPFPSGSDSPIPRFPLDFRLVSVLPLWFGISKPVGRASYAVSGFGLMLLKYGAEAFLIWIYTATVFWPWDFLNPLLSMRMRILEPAPGWVPWAMFVWTLPFLWIAVSMSVRRAADAGGSPWLGLLVLVPLINLGVMLILACLPSAPEGKWSRSGPAASDEGRVKSALLGVVTSVIIGGVMLLASVYLGSTYGASLFLGAPLLMGAGGSYVYNRPHPRGYISSIGVGLAAIVCSGAVLLLFALEGAICLLMAAPLVLPIGALGGLIGKGIAESTRRPYRDMIAAAIILPLLAGAESRWVHAIEYKVTTAVEIDAPPETVWHHVVHFPELSEPTEWYFRFGIAYPQRARIVGQGVGATRFCEFSTGAFVEPITAWQPPRRLAFDVTDQPAPMFELSPYRNVHPPHLDGYLRSNHGEFLLVRLPGNRTRLEGRTSYEFNMFPQWYWTLWSDLVIHQIHHRVLDHIKHLSEQPPALSLVPS